MKGNDHILRVERIFIHFLDKELLRLIGVESLRKKSDIYEEIRLALKLALLVCSNSVIIPISNYFENKITQTVLKGFNAFGDFGYIQFASGASDISEFIFDKQNQYKDYPNQHPIYFNNPGTLFIPQNGSWLMRENSATKDIKQAWNKSIGRTSTWDEIYKLSSIGNISKFESLLSNVPNLLENHAFIADFVAPFIPAEQNKRKFINQRLNILITQNYIKSFTDEFDAYCMTDFIHFKVNAVQKTVNKTISFANLIRALSAENLLEEVKNSEDEKLMLLKTSKTWELFLSKYLSYNLFGISIVNIKHTSMKVKAFISYSHADEEYKNRFTVGLKVLDRIGKIDVWNDTNIVAGQNLEPEIFEKLNTYELIFLLVSPDFINSDFCYNKEFTPTFERHKKGECIIVPIIIRPTPLWTQLPFAEIKSLPKDGIAVSEWSNQDLAWKNVIEEVAKTIELINSKKFIK